jgi:hypothetical protein
MSLYPVAVSQDVAALRDDALTSFSAEVGWNAATGSYWFIVMDSDGQRLTSGGLDCREEEEDGMPTKLVSLYDLHAASSTVIDWTKAVATLRMLRDDPWVERAKEAPDTPTSEQLQHVFGYVA